MKTKNLYSSIIENIFLERFTPNATKIEFERQDIIEKAKYLGIPLPKNTL